MPPQKSKNKKNAGLKHLRLLRHLRHFRAFFTSLATTSQHARHQLAGAAPGERSIIPPFGAGSYWVGSNQVAASTIRRRLTYLLLCQLTACCMLAAEWPATPAGGCGLCPAAGHCSSPRLGALALGGDGGRGPGARCAAARRLGSAAHSSRAVQLRGGSGAAAVRRTARPPAAVLRSSKCCVHALHLLCIIEKAPLRCRRNYFCCVLSVSCRWEDDVGPPRDLSPAEQQQRPKETRKSCSSRQQSTAQRA